VTTRKARLEDAAAIARIYNEGIADGFATFETRPRTTRDVQQWLDEGVPVVVGEDENRVVAWAAAHPYRPAREAYRGVGEFSIYVARDERGRRAGKTTLAALAAECEARGYWKLLSRIFPENKASLALCESLGFREVGVYRRHGKLDGEWRDVVIVELLLGDAARE
jgi:L-amino acid N-acyltransferase YncA